MRCDKATEAQMYLKRFKSQHFLIQALLLRSKTLT